MEIKLKNMTSNMGPPPPQRRPDDRRHYDRQDDRRRSQKGPSAHQSEDGWTNVPTKVAKTQNEKIDPNRIRSMQSSKVDADSMSLGPPRSGPSLSSWGRGSQSGKNSRQEQSMNHNRFSHLDQSEAPGHYEGRGSDGRYPRQNSQQDRYHGRNSRYTLINHSNFF